MSISSNSKIFIVSILACACLFSLSACGGDKQKEAETQQDAQSTVSTTVAAPKPPAPGEVYLEVTDMEARMKAAKEAERYIKEETKNHLDRLVLNPESEYWNFPGDLSEFNEPGKIITYDAYVDGNSVSPYRIVLIRGGENAKWEVKRFSKDNENLTGESGQSKENSSSANNSNKNNNNN